MRTGKSDSVQAVKVREMETSKWLTKLHLNITPVSWFQSAQYNPKKPMLYRDRSPDLNECKMQLLRLDVPGDI